MREAFGPPLKAAAITAFLAGLALLILNPPSFAGIEGLISILAGAIAVVVLAAWVVVLVTGREMPEPEFQRLVERSDKLAGLPPPDEPLSEFDELVAEALDALPEAFHDALATTPVVVSHRGREHQAYGHYMGDTVARDNYADRIVIYQDTLERDFGHDPDRLRTEVERTVRHELAHHLGWNEDGVRELGL